MNRKSIYRYASEAGLPVGIYLSLMSACLLMSVKIPFLATLNLPLAIIFPFYLAFFIKKIGKIEPSYMKFSSLWLAGIYTVIFGTLICMFFSALYIQFVEPGFVQAYFISMIENIESSPFAEEYGPTLDIMRNAMESRLLPTSTDFITSLGWFTSFSGAVLSLFIALILSKTSSKVSKAIS